MGLSGFVPNINASESNKLDCRSVRFLKDILPDDLVDTRQLQEGGTLPNIDGFFDLLCEDGTAYGRITVQIKHLTYPESNGDAYYDIPKSIFAYADRLKGDVVLFIAVDFNNEKFYWKNIDSNAIEDFKNRSDHIQETARCHFKSEEICSKHNVVDTIKTWRDIYQNKMHFIKDDRHIAESFAAQQKASFNMVSTNLHGVANSHISRHQVIEIHDWISNGIGSDKQICLLIGNAGVGKSAVLKEVIDSLSNESAKCLCIKADSIDNAGNKVTLSQMLDTIGYYSMEGKKVLLIVDQIDALSQNMSNDREHLNMMMTMLSSLYEWPNVRAIVSCRRYDLDYDSDLCSLKDKAMLIELGELTSDEVSKALDKLSNGLKAKLDSTTFNILKTVQYLDTFCFLYKKNKSKYNFGSPSELYDALWDEYVDRVKNSHETESIERVLFQIAETIRISGTLKPTLIPTTEQKPIFEYLASVGLIKKDGSSVSFFHQTFYEYTLARRYVSLGKSLLDDIKDEFQGLEIRSIVKAVLEYERGHNDVIFADEVSSILLSDKIRLHIKLLAISVLSSADNPKPIEKKLVKRLIQKDERHLMYFLRGVHDDGWFTIVKGVVRSILPCLTKESRVFFQIIGCLSNFTFNHPNDVYCLVYEISDNESRSFAIANILRSHNDYKNPIVLKAYNDAKPQNIHFAAELIKDAFQTNETFAFSETQKLLTDYLISIGKENRHNGYELVDVLFPILSSNRPKEFLQVLHNSIAQTIEQTAYDGYYGYTITTVFDGFSLDDSVEKVLIMYEDLLTRFSSDEVFIRPMIEKLLALQNETTVSMAFSAMSASPQSYIDIIRPLTANSKRIESYLHGDIQYYFLKLLKSWYLIISKTDAECYQRMLLSFKSSTDHVYDKTRRWSNFIFPNLWRDKWDLICNTLPEDGLIPEMKKCSQELMRRFGKRSIVNKPNHQVTAACICGGIVDDKTYSKLPISNWLSSFLKLDENRGWRENAAPISLNVHADAFKKCVTENPNKFRAFIYEISTRDDIKRLYKVAGLEGLLAGGDNPYSLWSLVKPLISIEYAKENSYSFMQIADYYVKEENEYLDDVIRVAESIVTLPFDIKRNSGYSEEESYDIGRRATKLLELAINSPQGHALELLIHTCSLPSRRVQAYGIISKIQVRLPKCLKSLPLHYLYVNGPFDETLYFPLMKQLLNDFGPEALVIRGDAIQRCFYHRNDFVNEYINKIETDEASHEILCQIYFYGLSSEAHREECENRLENVLTKGNEKVIAKIVEISLKSYSRPELCTFSKKYLERYASDSQGSVADSYCWYCSSLPIEAFDFYCSIASSWAGKQYREIHHELEYVKKCISSFPEKCYRFIKSQQYSEIDNQLIADDEIVKVLLEIYKKLKEYEDEESMNEIMDLFDEYIYRGNRMIMDALGKIG